MAKSCGFYKPRKWFHQPTLKAKWVTSCETAWKTVPKNGVISCLHAFLFKNACAFGKMWKPVVPTNHCGKIDIYTNKNFHVVEGTSWKRTVLWQRYVIVLWPVDIKGTQFEKYLRWKRLDGWELNSWLVSRRVFDRGSGVKVDPAMWLPGQSAPNHIGDTNNESSLAFAHLHS